jgi:glycogenin glucosyltransferase
METGRNSRTRSGNAFATLLMLNDSYLPGALMTGNGLRKQKVSSDLVCLVTEEISRPAREALRQVFDHVIEVEKIRVAHSRAQKRQYLPYVFTKMNALRLGADGDLGTSYRKILMLDADMLPLSRFQRLFELDAPAGILNESKSHLLSADEGGAFEIPDDVLRTGKWHWHKLYEPICPHGERIPAWLTDRVKEQRGNMGINGSLMLVKPSLAEYHEIRRDIESPANLRLLGEFFDWPEMQYLTMRWSGRWTNIDARYSGLNGYPNLELLYGTHFAGFKPWYFRREKSMQRYGRYPDFQRWFREYREMVTEIYPALQKSKRVRRLLDEIVARRMIYL